MGTRMKRNILLSMMLLGFGSSVFGGTTGYLKVEDNHAVSDYVKTESGYSYNLFCTETQKLQPSDNFTTKCDFCENDISQLTRYVSEYDETIDSSKSTYTTIFIAILFACIVFVGFITIR